MLHTIIDPYAMFAPQSSANCVNSARRSSNPYDYIRTGYFVDNAELYGGYNNVSFNCNIPSYCPGNMLGAAYK